MEILEGTLKIGDSKCPYVYIKIINWYWLTLSTHLLTRCITLFSSSSTTPCINSRQQARYWRSRHSPWTWAEWLASRTTTERCPRPRKDSASLLKSPTIGTEGFLFPVCSFHYPIFKIEYIPSYIISTLSLPHSLTPSFPHSLTHSSPSPSPSSSLATPAWRTVGSSTTPTAFTASSLGSPLTPSKHTSRWVYVLD